MSAEVQSWAVPRDVLAVDPGIRGCGVALFQDGQLDRAQYVENPCRRGCSLVEIRAMAEAVAGAQFSVARLTLALEFPRVYPGPQQKGDQNDLLPLAGIVSALAAMYPLAQVRHYFPRDWKGTIDPDVLIERVKARLSPEEHARVELPRASLAHNVYDACGIGLHALGRLAPKKVFAR